jgi:hypothetical protein
MVIITTITTASFYAYTTSLIAPTANCRFSVVYGAFNGWLVWYTHRTGFKRKVYIVFLVSSVFAIILSGIATVFSAFKFGGNTPVKNIWGAHFNVGTDINLGCGAFTGFIVVGNKSNWTMRYADDNVRSLWYRDLRHFLYLILILLLCVLGFLSSLASIYNFSGTKFSEISGWYIGFVCWIMSSFIFFVGELEFIIDLCRRNV